MNEHAIGRRILGLPASRLGWWSVGLEVAFFALLMLWQGLNRAGYGGREAFFEHPFVTSLVLAAMASALAGGVTSFMSILRSRERSLLVFAALAVAIFVFLFTLAEFTVEGRQ
jgi:uncharacterized membrane protein